MTTLLVVSRCMVCAVKSVLTCMATPFAGSMLRTCRGFRSGCPSCSTKGSILKYLKGEEYLKIEAADDLKEAADARVYPVEMRGLVRVQRHGVF